MPASKKNNIKPVIQDTHRVVMLGFPGAQILDITGPLEVFSRTTRWLKDNKIVGYNAYDVEVIAATAGPVTCSSGIELLAKRSYREVSSINTLLISGGIGYRNVVDDTDLIRWITQQYEHVDRIGSICTGAFILAATSLLAGKRATTHWAYCKKLSELNPGITVDYEAIYVKQEKLYTSAGVTAGMDLALGMVEEDWGRGVALAVAKELVLYLKRPGGQSQTSALLDDQEREIDLLNELKIWMLENLEQDLSVNTLADRVSMSPRNFARRFNEAFGATPAKFVESMRIESARRKLEDTKVSLESVARKCGFVTNETMRRAFVRQLGVTPNEYRSKARGDSKERCY